MRARAYVYKKALATSRDQSDGARKQNEVMLAVRSRSYACFALVVRVAYGFAYLVYLLTLFDTLLLFWCFERYIALAHRSA